MKNNLYSLKVASVFAKWQSKRKLLCCLLLSIGACFFSSAQTPGQWVWLDGDSAGNSAGNFGTQGIASSTNQPPALSSMCKWTDKNGNFWFYGGQDNSYGLHNDLWKYNPVTQEWTWMTGTGIVNDTGDYGTQGVESPSNRPPGSYSSQTWVDSSGNFWIFGFFYSFGYVYDDLWKYDISSNEWTWIKGPHVDGDLGSYGIQGVPDSSNNPELMDGGSGWTDNAGNLWLYGNTHNSSLWRFNIATNTWTWMRGSNNGNYRTGELAVYGKMNVEDSANYPGVRVNFWSWKDNNGNFWLFGGSTHATFEMNVAKNDLWRFNPVSGNWTWINGDSSSNAFNELIYNDYGTKCITNPMNTPDGRYNNGSASASWKDSDGNLWMFGGLGGNAMGQPGCLLNDLWMYCIAGNQWTWKGGPDCNIYIDPDSAEAAPGSWGTLDVSSATNNPNSLLGAIGWADNKGHLYLFGGIDLNSNKYNTLWSFTIDSSCGTCPTVPVTSFQSDNAYICPNSCINFTDLSQNATSWQWSFPWAVPASSSAQNPQNICYPLVGNYDVTLITGNAYGSDTLIYTYYITVHPAPTAPVISQSGDTLLSSPSYTYQWYFNNSIITGATKQFYIPSQIGSYTVSIMDANGCPAISASFYVTTVGITDLISNNSFLIYPNPASDYVTIFFSPLLGRGAGGEVSIYNVMGQEILSRHFIGSTFSLPLWGGAGIYFLQVTNESGSWVKKFIKE